MKKVIAIVMAMMMAMTMIPASASQMTDELLANANANGKLVSGTLSFEAGDLSILGDEQLQTIVTDILNATSITVMGQDNRAEIQIGMGDGIAATAGIELGGDTLYIESNWLPNTIAVTGEDIRSLIVDTVVPMVKANADQDTIQALAMVEPYLSSFDYNFNVTSFIQLYDQLDALMAQLEEALAEILKMFDGAFPKTEAYVNEIAKVDTVSAATYGYEGTAEHVVVHMTKDEMNHLVAVVCEDLSANASLTSLIDMALSSSGAQITSAQLLAELPQVVEEALKDNNVAVDEEFVVTENGDVLEMTVAYTMQIEGQPVSEVIHVTDTLEDGVQYVIMTMDMTMGIENMMSMICSYVEDAANYANAMSMTTYFGEALTGVEDASITTNMNSAAVVDDNGDVYAVENADVTLGAGLGGNGSPIIAMSVTMNSSDPIGSGVENPVRLSEIDEAWLEKLQNHAMTKLFSTLSMMPESVMNLFMNNQ